MGNTPLIPSKIWRYLGFFFDRKLLFKKHAMCYARKAFLAMETMLTLGNLVHGLKPKHKCLLYQSCIIPIALYGICLWYYNRAQYRGIIKELTRVQCCAVIWILGAFKTTPIGAVESLAGLILIDLQIQKLVYCNHICMHMLADSHLMQRVSASENQADNVVYLPSKLAKKPSPPSSICGPTKSWSQSTLFHSTNSVLQDTIYLTNSWIVLYHMTLSSYPAKMPKNKPNQEKPIFCL